jgi:hypothetical protein
VYETPDRDEVHARRNGMTSFGLKIVPMRLSQHEKNKKDFLKKVFAIRPR